MCTLCDTNTKQSVLYRQSNRQSGIISTTPTFYPWHHLDDWYCSLTDYSTRDPHKHQSCYWPFVWEIHQWQMDSPHECLINAERVTISWRHQVPFPMPSQHPHPSTLYAIRSSIYPLRLLIFPLLFIFTWRPWLIYTLPCVFDIHRVTSNTNLAYGVLLVSFNQRYM